MDQKVPEYVDGQVKVHPLAREFMRVCGEGGWIAATFPFDEGGLQIPITLDTACNFLFMASNLAAAAYPGLTKGAAHLILSYGTEELEKIRGEHDFRQMAGHHGADRTPGRQFADRHHHHRRADRDGYYLISGQKIFISAGDHDGVDNVVHLMLARIKGAPPGVKGISLFVVPQQRPEGGSSSPTTVTVRSSTRWATGCPIRS